MANHLRRQIREAVATLLTGLTTTGSRVFQSRIYPLESTDLPGLRIYSKDERLDTSTIHAPALQDRILEIVVEGVARAVADLDDTLDQICKEVDVVLGSALSQVQMGGANQIAYRSTKIEMNRDGAVPVGIARLTYEASYVCAANAPDVAL